MLTGDKYIKRPRALQFENSEKVMLKEGARGTRPLHSPPKPIVAELSI